MPTRASTVSSSRRTPLFEPSSHLREDGPLRSSPLGRHFRGAPRRDEPPFEEGCDEPEGGVSGKRVSHVRQATDEVPSDGPGVHLLADVPHVHESQGGVQAHDVSQTDQEPVGEGRPGVRGVDGDHGVRGVDPVLFVLQPQSRSGGVRGGKVGAGGLSGRRRGCRDGVLVRRQQVHAGGGEPLARGGAEGRVDVRVRRARQRLLHPVRLSVLRAAGAVADPDDERFPAQVAVRGAVRRRAVLLPLLRLLRVQRAAVPGAHGLAGVSHRLDHARDAARDPGRFQSHQVRVGHLFPLTTENSPTGTAAQRVAPNISNNLVSQYHHITTNATRALHLLTYVRKVQVFWHRRLIESRRPRRRSRVGHWPSMQQASDDSPIPVAIGRLDLPKK